MLAPRVADGGQGADFLSRGSRRGNGRPRSTRGRVRRPCFLGSSDVGYAAPRATKQLAHGSWRSSPVSFTSRECPSRLVDEAGDIRHEPRANALMADITRLIHESAPAIGSGDIRHEPRAGALRRSWAAYPTWEEPRNHGLHTRPRVERGRPFPRRLPRERGVGPLSSIRDTRRKHSPRAEFVEFSGRYSASTRTSRSFAPLEGPTSPRRRDREVLVDALCAPKNSTKLSPWICCATCRR